MFKILEWLYVMVVLSSTFLNDGTEIVETVDGKKIICIHSADGRNGNLPSLVRRYHPDWIVTCSPNKAARNYRHVLRDYGAKVLGDEWYGRTGSFIPMAEIPAMRRGMPYLHYVFTARYFEEFMNTEEFDLPEEVFDLMC